MLDMESSSDPMNDEIPSSPPLQSSGARINSQSRSNKDTYLTRPNRYFGPESTWLNWTKNERGQVEALDETRSQDLSLHLLNAHGLERASHQPARKLRAEWDCEGQTSSLDNRESEEQATFHYPRSWTAWPLPPDQVPRESQSQTSDEVNEGILGERPSAELEELLLAHVMRVARQRWQSRPWDAGYGSKLRSKEERSAGLARASTERTMETDAANSASSESELGEGMIVSQVYLAESDEEVAEDIKPKTQYSSESEDQDDAPTPMADNNVARNLLLPSVRQTLSKLDDLLGALHKARRSYSSALPYPDENYETDTDTSGPGRSRSRKRRRSQPRHLPNDAADGNRGNLTSSQPRRELGLRDWSDVVGMAALSGWDTEVVGGASEKCANLFKENMSFRTFQEPHTNNKTARWEAFGAVEGQGDSDSEVEGDDVAGHRIRASQPCDLCRVTKSKCLADPAPRSTSKSCLRCDAHFERCSGITTQLTALICPHKDCGRHREPFKKSIHLQRHIDEVHVAEFGAPSLSSPALISSASEGYISGDETFICPVLDCPRRYKSFNRATRFYQHLRKMHPEIDTDEVKRLEAQRRGEKRGRWLHPERREEVMRRARSKSLGRTSSPPRDFEADEDLDDVSET